MAKADYQRIGIDIKDLESRFNTDSSYHRYMPHVCAIYQNLWSANPNGMDSMVRTYNMAIRTLHEADAAAFHALKPLIDELEISDGADGRTELYARALNEIFVQENQLKQSSILSFSEAAVQQIEACLKRLRPMPEKYLGLFDLADSETMSRVRLGMKIPEYDRYLDAEVKFMIESNSKPWGAVGRLGYKVSQFENLYESTAPDSIYDFMTIVNLLVLLNLHLSSNGGTSARSEPVSRYQFKGLYSIWDMGTRVQIRDERLANGAVPNKNHPLQNKETMAVIALTLAASKSRSKSAFSSESGIKVVLTADEISSHFKEFGKKTAAITSKQLIVSVKDAIRKVIALTPDEMNVSLTNSGEQCLSFNSKPSRNK